VKYLPREFAGPKHIAIAKMRDKDGIHCEFEERPGPAPPGSEEDIPWIVLTEAESRM
jgi:hypothetical protein